MRQMAQCMGKNKTEQTEIFEKIEVEISEEEFARFYVEHDPHSPEDMASKIALLLNNENLRKDLIKKGLENIEKYDWIECAKETLEVYNSVL